MFSPKAHAGVALETFRRFSRIAPDGDHRLRMAMIRVASRRADTVCSSMKKFNFCSVASFAMASVSMFPDSTIEPECLTQTASSLPTRRHQYLCRTALACLMIALPLTASGANPIPTGLQAEYLLMDGTGTTVSDASGLKHTASFGSPGPAWTTWGVNFNPTSGTVAQTINLPAAVNNWATAVFHVCPKIGPQSTTPAGPAETWSQYQILMGSTDFSGAALATAYLTTSSGNGGSAAYDGFIVPQIWNKLNSATTAASDGFGACSTVAYVRDATQDHLYVNGVETAYVRNGGSLSYSVSANYTIGSSGASQTWSGLMGNVAYAAFWSSELTGSQVAQVSNYVTSLVEARPGYPATAVSTASGNQLIAAGDSITAGYGSQPWTSYLNLTNTYNVQNWGVGGQNVANIRVMGPVRDMTGVATSGNNTFMIYAGTNDVCIDGYTAAQAWQNILQAIQARRALGARVLVADIISRTGCDSTRDSLNASIRSGWQTAGANGFIDLAASTSIGNDGAYTKTAYFQSDGTHLTVAGEEIVAEFVSNAINYLDGSSSANPTIVSSSTYTATWAAAGFLQPAANTTITLPDCQGMTGQPVEILNTGYSVSVTGSASETINGSSSYTVPPSGATLLTPSFSGATTAGCTWSASTAPTSPLSSMQIGTVASASSISPTTQIVNLTGTMTVNTMTLPAGMSTNTGGCLYLIPASNLSTSATGNFSAAYTLNAGVLYIACWNGAKWYVK